MSSARTRRMLVRQWRLILALQARRRGMSQADLLAHLGASRATLYRDLAALQDAGVPIAVSTEDGSATYSLLGDRFPALIPGGQSGAASTADDDETRGQASGALVVRLAPDVAHLADARPAAADQRSDRRPDGCVLVTATVIERRAALRWALGFGASAEVHEPEWLRRAVVDECCRTARQYADVPCTHLIALRAPRAR